MKYPDFDDAACKSFPTDIFYPIETPDGKPGPGYIDFKATAAICASCPIMNECLEWALHHEAHGIWAGTTSSSREVIRKKRNIKLVDPMYVSDSRAIGVKQTS